MPPFRLSVCLLATLCVCACVPLRAPLGDLPGPPALIGGTLADGFFVTRDGIRLPMREWDAAGPYRGHPRAVILALHGMDDYSHAFAMPAPFWARSGITTLAYDQRGFGAGPDPGSWAGGAVMRRDLCDFVAVARARFPGVPLFVLGESMGGAVVLTALAGDKGTDADFSSQIDGAILVAPAVWARSDMPLSYRVALFVVAHLFPGMILSNSAASHVVTIIPSDNIAMLRELARDPLVLKKTRADTLLGLVNLMDQAHAAPARIKAPPPLLLLYGAHDQVIPAASTRAVIAELHKVAGKKLSVRHYPNGYHMLLRDLDGRVVQADTAAWVLGHAGSGKTAVRVRPSLDALHTGKR